MSAVVRFLRSVLLPSKQRGGDKTDLHKLFDVSRDDHVAVMRRCLREHVGMDVEIADGKAIMDAQRFADLVADYLNAHNAVAEASRIMKFVGDSLLRRGDQFRADVMEPSTRLAHAVSEDAPRERAHERVEHASIEDRGHTGFSDPSQLS